MKSDETRNRKPALSEKIAGSVFCFADAQVNPILLTLGFVEADTRYKGTKLFTHTKVLEIKQQGSHIKEIITNHGNVKVGIIINAADVYAPEIGLKVN